MLMSMCAKSWLTVRSSRRDILLSFIDTQMTSGLFVYILYSRMYQFFFSYLLDSINVQFKQDGVCRIFLQIIQKK